MVDHRGVPTETTSDCRALSDFTTNAGAELYGIQEALTRLEQFTRMETLGSAYLFSDSQFAVAAARSGSPGSHDNHWTIAESIRNLKKTIRLRGTRLVIGWVPGHAGIDINEAADKAADDLQQANGHNMYWVPIPYSLARSMVTKRVKKKIEEWWTLTGRGRRLFEIHKNPNTGPPAAFGSLSKRLRTCITRLRVDNATTNEILFLIGEKPSKQCDHCLDTADSADHRFFSCNAYNEHRERLRQKILHDSGMTDLNRGLVFGLNINVKFHKTIVDEVGTFLGSTGLDSLFLYKRKYP